LPVDAAQILRRRSSEFNAEGFHRPSTVA
jgi:hypothetical protein